MIKKDYLHNPVHIFIDDSTYFITSAIYKKRPLLQQAELKELLLNCIKCSFERYHWKLHHWVILDNHYHLLVTSRKGDDLAEIIKKIHSLSGFYIKKETQAQSPIWWNYWDYCPRDEKDYFVHLNYLFNNPIKHGYVNNLHDYPFSSFHCYFEKHGRELLTNQFKNHSTYKNLILHEDNF